MPTPKYPKGSLFYGAFHYALHSRDDVPAYAVSKADREVYEIVTDVGQYFVYVKYSANEKKNGRRIYWTFSFNAPEWKKIKKLMADAAKEKKLFRLALVCTRYRGKSEICGTEIALLDEVQIDKCLGLSKLPDLNDSRNLTISDVPKSHGLFASGPGLDKDEEELRISRDEVEKM